MVECQFFLKLFRKILAGDPMHPQDPGPVLVDANMHHAKLSFCSSDPSTFDAPWIPTKHECRASGDQTNEGSFSFSCNEQSSTDIVGTAI